MVVKARTFTPEVMLSAPRRGSAVPNHDGTLALYTISTYSFDSHEETSEIRILDVNTGSSMLFTNDRDAYDAIWLGDGTNAIIWLQSGAKGITSIMIGDGDDPSKLSYTVDVIPAPIGNLKVTSFLDGSIACAMTGLATPEGSLYNKKTAKKPKSSARIYDNLFVRYWNRYIIPQRNVIWYSKLAKSDSKYSLTVPVQNAMKGTDFECPLESNGVSEFDISPTGILFKSRDRTKDPNVCPSSIYYVPLSTFEENEAPKAQRIDTGVYTGSTSNPRFSPCGRKAALLVNPSITNVFETRIMLISDLMESLNAVNVLGFANAGLWELSPSGFEWFQSGGGLYLTADDCGRVKLFALDFSTLESQNCPKPLTQDGAISAYYPFGNGDEKLLVSSSSLIDDSAFSIIDCSEPENKVTISSSSKNGLKLGLNPEQVSEIWFEGAEDYCVQAWVVKPTFFDEAKKYPLALLIHGGPQAGWRDAWSNCWNPAVWAEQGYVCVLPNITGSVGFGASFTKGVNGQWGGRPYKDLENCFEHVKISMPFVDTDNAIAAGASYGGYMAYWIQGNPLGRLFKTIVSHHDTQSLNAGDIFDAKGGQNFEGSMLPWENYQNLEKYNPARHDLLKNWKTPMLVIHSDQDYRCVMSEGLAAFAVCQELGTPSRFLNFPDESLCIGPRKQPGLAQTVFDWINKYSGITEKKQLEEQMPRLTRQELN